MFGAQPLFFMSTTVTKTYDPYIWKDVARLHSEMTRDFGRVGIRWRLRIVTPTSFTSSDLPRTYEYTFEDPHDAMIYAIKYSERQVDRKFINCYNIT